MDKQKIVYIGTIEEKEKQYIKNNNAELKKTLESASINDIVNQEIWSHLNDDEAKQLRRWVNQFIKANIEKPDELSDTVAYPYMNKKLRRILEKVSLRVRAEQTAKAIKEIKKGTKKNENIR